MSCVLESNTWTNRLIKGLRIGVAQPPEWLIDSYRIFRATVLHPEYPCYYGSNAERSGEMFYSYVEDDHLDDLPNALATFVGVTSERDDERNNLAVFFKPYAETLSHDEYRSRFWRCLQYLYDRDPARNAGAELQPSDALWEFPFAGLQFFVVGISPSYAARRSRNLGPGMVLLFQPRDVFFDDVTGKPISAAARVTVRKRLANWDRVAAHPDLNTFGTPHNREWKQYFLPDDDQIETGRCPLAVRAHDSSRADELKPAPVELGSEEADECNAARGLNDDDRG